MKRLLLLALLAVAGCDGDSITSQEIKTARVDHGAHIYTSEHDGHKFVVLLYYSDGCALMHHPDCPCMKKAERE